MQRTTNLGISIEQEAYDREGLRRAHNLLEVKFRKARKCEFRADSAMKADESKMRKKVIFIMTALMLLYTLGLRPTKDSFQHFGRSFRDGTKTSEFVDFGICQKKLVFYRVMVMFVVVLILWIPAEICARVA